MASLYDERVLGAQQRAEFARKLRESSNQPAGQMVSGWYVPNTGGAVVDALRNIMGAYQEREATDEIKGLQREKLQSTIQAMNQAGIQAPESMLKEAGTPEVKPGMWDRLTATLRGEEAKGTPAQPYQQNVAQNATPEQREAGLMNLLQVNPDVASGAIGLYNASTNRALTKAEKQYQHEKDLREEASKKEDAQLNRDLKIQLAQIAAGNRQPSQPYGIETVNGQPVRINKVTGEIQAANVPGISNQQGLGQPKYDSGSDQWVYPPSAEHPAGIFTPAPAKMAAVENFKNIAGEMLPKVNETTGEVTKGVLGKTDTGGFMGYKALTSQITNKNESDIFDNNLARLGTELRKIMRIPGEGAFSDKEQAQFGLTLPNKKYNPETNEKIMKDLVAQITTSVYPTGVSAIEQPQLKRFQQPVQQVNQQADPFAGFTEQQKAQFLKENPNYGK